MTGRLIVPGQPEQPAGESRMVACAKGCGGNIEVGPEQLKLGAGTRFPVQHEECPPDAETRRASLRRFRAEVRVYEEEVLEDAALLAGEVVKQVLDQAHATGHLQAEGEVSTERLALAVVTALSGANLLLVDDEAVIARGGGTAEAPTFVQAVEQLGQSLAAGWDRMVKAAPLVDADAGEAL